MVVAPEHPLIDELIASGKASDELKAFVEEQKAIAPEHRIAEVGKKRASSPAWAVNPFNRERLPVWIANFVLLVTAQARSWSCLRTTSAISSSRANTGCRFQA